MRAVSSFAADLLGDDLPGLPPDHLAAAVAFVEERVSVLPSVTRLGVLVIASTVGAASRLAGARRVRRVVTSLPLPLLSEYPRLVRSLGYAFVWETWPDSDIDGTPGDGTPAVVHA